MYCGKCGAEVSEAAKFCTKCGTPCRVSPISEGVVSAGDDRVRQTKEWLELALKTEDPEKKLEYCNRYLDAYPHDAEVWNYKSVLLTDLGRSGEARACGEELAALWDEKYAAGMIKLVREDSSKALSIFSDLLEEDPSRVDALLGKAEALKNLNRYQESMACVEQVLGLNPSKLALAQAWIVRGLALAGLGKLNEAVECYDRSLEIDVCSTRGLMMKTMALDELQRYEEAIACCDQILQKYPRHEELSATIENKKVLEANLREQRRMEGRRGKSPPNSCGKCGGPLLKGAKFCTRCGSATA